MKKRILIIFSLFINLLSFADNIEQGEYFGSQSGVRSITISDVTDSKFNLTLNYKKIVLLNEPYLEKDKTTEFFKIRPDLYGTKGLVGEEKDGVYCQLKDGLMILFKVQNFLINEINFITKQEDKEKFKELKKDYASMIKKYICLTEISTIHEKNKGKIVFSKQPIVKNKEQESQFVNDWNLTDELYMRIYLDKSAGNSAYENFTRFDSYGYNFYLDGVLIKEFGYSTGHTGYDYKLMNTETTFQEGIMGKKEYLDMAHIGFKTSLMNYESKFTPGVHNLQRAFFVKGDGVVKEISKGEVKVTISQPVLTKLMNDSEFWGIPKAKTINKTYEQDILEAIDSYSKSRGWKEDFTKVTLTSDFWILNNENSGAIVGRAIQAACFAKRPDGHCTFQYINFQQQYAGNGSYAPNFYYYSIGTQFGTPCNFASPKK